VRREDRERIREGKESGMEWKVKGEENKWVGRGKGDERKGKERKILVKQLSPPLPTQQQILAMPLQAVSVLHRNNILNKISVHYIAACHCDYESV